MNQYVVFSYDANEQQAFTDTIPADSKDAAGEQIAEERDYAIVTDVWELDALIDVLIREREKAR